MTLFYYTIVWAGRVNLGSGTLSVGCLWRFGTMAEIFNMQAIQIAIKRISRNISSLGSPTLARFAHAQLKA